MKRKTRFREARLVVGAGTAALLVGLWSALTVHDLQANQQDPNASQNNSTITTGTNGTVITAPSSNRSITTLPSTSRSITTVPHTRTHSS